MFSASQSIPDLGTVLPQDLDDIWNVWARSEEITRYVSQNFRSGFGQGFAMPETTPWSDYSLRTVLGLYVHDTQLVTTFHHDPTLRHSSIRLSVAANDNMFAASSVAQ
jgi:hypothetical protein